MRPSSQQAASAMPILPLASDFGTTHSAVAIIPGSAGRGRPRGPTAAINVVPYGADAVSQVRDTFVPERHLFHRAIWADVRSLNEVLSHWPETLSPVATRKAATEYRRESSGKSQVFVRTRTVTFRTTYSATLLEIAKELGRVARKVDVEHPVKWTDSDDLHWRHLPSAVHKAKESTERYRVVYLADGKSVYKSFRPSTSAPEFDWLKPTVHDVEGTTHRGMAQLFRWFGKTVVADRIEELLAIAEEDQDEPHMSIDSLRNLGRLLIAEQELTEPDIGVTPNGLVQAQWSTPGNGVVAMEFLVSGLVRFAAISAPAKRGVKRKAVRGALEHKEMLHAIQPFSKQLLSK